MNSSYPLREGGSSKGGRHEERPRTERPNSTPPAQDPGRPVHSNQSTQDSGGTPPSQSQNQE